MRADGLRNALAGNIDHAILTLAFDETEVDLICGLMIIIHVA
jgi:hypothetical protein